LRDNASENDRIPQPIYLDYHATTPTDPRVAEVVLRFLTVNFGNAHSRDHCYGDYAEEAVERARQEVAALVGARGDEVVFTSGATEAINLALRGLAISKHRENPKQILRLAVSAAEHIAVLDTALTLQSEGLASVVILPVDQLGHVELSAVEDSSRTGLDVIAVMTANNEVGTITDLAAIADIAHRYDVLLFTDATQAVGKIDVTVSPGSVDLLALSAHKFYGPKGVGALVIRPGIRLSPIVHGGGHEKGLRSGTLNVPGIAGLGEAARLRRLEMANDELTTAEQRDRLQELLQAAMPEVVVSGDQKRRLAGNLHFCVPNIPNQAIIARLRNRVAISTGSACTSGIEVPSHVLRAMGLPREHVDGALRIGLGKFVSDADVTTAAETIANAAAEARIEA
jgi:cysteine desulfurase